MIEYISFTSLVTGVLYGIGAVGLGLIYKYLKFPDFTTTVSITSGAIIMASLGEHSLLLGFIIGTLFGGLLGLLTFLQIRFINVPPILAGIITSVGSISFQYIFTNNEANVNLDNDLRETLDIFINNSFSWFEFFKVFLFSFLLVFVISRIFTTKYGLYILALLGTNHYVKYRHKKSNLALFILLVFGNMIISLSGTLLTIQSGFASIDGFSDFLVSALSGFVLAIFFIDLLSGKDTKKYLEKENKPSGNFFSKILLIINSKLKLNDEHPTKIFWFLIFVVASTTLVHLIFEVITLKTNNNKITYLLKAIVFLSVLALSRFQEYIVNHKFEQNI